jgi:hypothetical protein
VRNDTGELKSPPEINRFQVQMGFGDCRKIPNKPRIKRKGSLNTGTIKLWLRKQVYVPSDLETEEACAIHKASSSGKL